jgi:hypothetical protein
MEINYQEIYNQMIDDSKMNIDFIDIHTYSLSQLTNLINEYTETVKTYKDKPVRAYDELENIFGKDNPYLVKPRENMFDRIQTNTELWLAYKKKLYSNYKNAKALRDQKQKDKRKEDIKNYNSQKKVCDICQGKYVVKNKAKHCKTKKHIDFLKITDID